MCHFRIILLYLVMIVLAACNGNGTAVSLLTPVTLAFKVQPGNKTPSGTTNGIISPAVQVAIIDAKGQ